VFAGSIRRQPRLLTGRACASRNSTKRFRRNRYSSKSLNWRGRPTCQRARLDATLSLEGGLWEVSIHLCECQVELHYDPFDWSRVEIWYRERFVALARCCDKHLNAKTYSFHDYERSDTVPSTRNRRILSSWIRGLAALSSICAPTQLRRNIELVNLALRLFS
jgi:hypothetical protein